MCLDNMAWSGTNWLSWSKGLIVWYRLIMKCYARNYQKLKFKSKNKYWFTIWLWSGTGMVWPHRNLNTVCIRTWTRTRFMFNNFITWRCGRIGTRSRSLHRLKIIMKPKRLSFLFYHWGRSTRWC